jgi:nucleotide-binding universal stress UspA family protein
VRPGGAQGLHPSRTVHLGWQPVCSEINIMTFKPSVLCPLDFSESSRGALRYAGAVARRFGSSLTLLAVNDPLLDEAAELTGGHSYLVDETRREMEKFHRQAFGNNPHPAVEVHFEIASGKPAPEILRVARERRSDVIVMASHGSTGFRKLFFGSTTERVLRETAVPVLVTPGGDVAPTDLEDARKAIRRVLVPVDLTAASSHQLDIAGRLAEALSLPLLAVHVIEPVRAIVSTHGTPSTVETERRYRVEAQLERAIQALAGTPRAESLVAYGEPAEEIAKVASDRDVGLIVMGLHSSPVLGPRMGSVTYRVLCVAHRLVLALPPIPEEQTARARGNHRVRDDVGVQ